MSMGRQATISEATAQKIDAEVRRLVSQGYEDARKILTEKRGQPESVAQALLEFETLSGDEIKDLMAGRAIARPDPDGDGPKGPANSAVPAAGRTKPREEPGAGGMEPQPMG
jgi:cell division protease FtsH